MVEKSKLDEDKEGKAVDPSHYRGMIGTLLYLTASRPDLQFAICMCTRYQARPTEKHVHAIKRIFRYLRRTVNRGLWYLKDSSVALTTFADADHAGCQDTRNMLQPLPLIPNNRGRRVIPFDHFINNDLKYLRGATDRLQQARPLGVSHWGRKRQQLYGYAVNRESALDVYSKRRIIAVTELKIVEWHDYNHLDWVSVRRDDDQIYKFKEGDFKRLRLQDIEDMLLLLVQGKLSNLTVEERFAFNVSLRMFTRSIVIQRRVKDLQLGVESYQKRLNLINPDTDGTLNDVRNALDDRLKGIWMHYFPTTIWKRGDKDRAAAMIQAIEKMLKTRRILRSLEKFVGG
nr:uncharacterized mitochondrial protein AtMg00810-like [Tanacetum cinerariifolium]